MNKEFSYQQLNLEQFKTYVEWAAAEGWNPGIHDAEIFWNTDPQGFWGCFKDEEMVGGASMVSYDGLYGFMGFFIVKPEYRNAGLGRMLWSDKKIVLERLQPGAAVGMDGVVAMQPFYQKGGFEIAYKDVRYERTGTTFELSNTISKISASAIEEIMQLDLECFGVPRPRFLTPWLQQPDSFSYQCRENGQLKGFALLRKCFSGYKIGPLFADNTVVAEELYKACLHAVPGEPVFLDIPLCNPSALELVEKYDARYVFECARMYLGKPPAMNIKKVFGITSFELG